MSRVFPFRQGHKNDKHSDKFRFSILVVVMKRKMFKDKNPLRHMLHCTHFGSFGGGGVGDGDGPTLHSSEGIDLSGMNTFE